MDLTITDFYPGREGTKYENYLGGFICVDDKGTEIRIGGGFKDWQRVKYWEERNTLLGKIVEIKYTEVTQAGSVWNPRFHKFKDDVLEQPN
jgi:hypothetical protein